MITEREILFEEVCSTDFLKFKFGGRGYQVMLSKSSSFNLLDQFFMHFKFVGSNATFIAS
jgi:hypothetical protein